MIKPAMTAEEWAPVLRNDLERVALAREIMRCTLANQRCPVPAEGEVTHALAALCLHGQLFGFTREDVAGQRTIYQALLNAKGAYEAMRIAGLLEHPALPGLSNCEQRLLRAIAIAEGSLADRIEALLPPGSALPEEGQGNG